jgi:hypothetical protein
VSLLGRTAARNTGRQQAARLAAILPAPLERQPARMSQSSGPSGYECDKWAGNERCLITKKIWTRRQNRTTVGASIHTSAPSCHDGPAWSCTGALYPCICRQPPEKRQCLLGTDHLRCQLYARAFFDFNHCDGILALLSCLRFRGPPAYPPCLRLNLQKFRRRDDFRARRCA